MIGNALQNIEQIESSLWEAADQLRANSKLTSSEYAMPVLGVIFLRHAANRYYSAKASIEAEQAAGKMPKRPLVKADFVKRRAMLLPMQAPFDELKVDVLALPRVQQAANGFELIELLVQRSPSVASTREGRYFLRVCDRCQPVVGDDVLRCAWETMDSTCTPVASSLKDKRSRSVSTEVFLSPPLIR
jgi:hypothetical protein